MNTLDLTLNECTGICGSPDLLNSFTACFSGLKFEFNPLSTHWTSWYFTPTSLCSYFSMCNIFSGMF